MKKKENENLAGGEELSLFAKEIGEAGAASPQKVYQSQLLDTLPLHILQNITRLTIQSLANCL